MTPSPKISADLRCHRCGYDLRAHPPEGKCPECGTMVAESKQEALTPRRPRWRDSDPRWRRRMLAGVWVLVMLPLMDVLKETGWAEHVLVPNILGYGAVRTLSDTFLCGLPNLSYARGVYEPLVFCIGVVLLFSKERGRRRNKLDWTRRWGVISSYVVFVLGAARFLFVPALVLAGIAALFLGMPLTRQPGVTQLCVELSTGWLRYGPYPKEITIVVLAAFSSIAILLACIRLFDALRSSGPKRLATALLAPLALFAMFNLAQALRNALGVVSVVPSDVGRYEIYFWPELLVQNIASVWQFTLSGSLLVAVLVEATKWCVILTIAIWLSIAQLAARGRERKKAL